MNQLTQFKEEHTCAAKLTTQGQARQLAAQAVMHTVFAAEDGRLKTNSRFVAEVFGRRHDDVLKAHRNLDCSKEFNARNFAAVEYIDAKGEACPMIEMSFDGFMFLVMGFTGSKAAAIKEAYIAEFNRMRADLSQRQRDERLQAAEARAAYFEKYARLPIVPLTDETRAKVRRLLAERVPVTDVARICRCSQATVRMLRDTGSDVRTGDLFDAQEQ